MPKFIIGFMLLSLTFLYSKEICIKNFDTTVCEEFTLLNSVIVKSQLNKEELSKKIQKPFQQIAFLGESNLYLIPSNTPLEEAKNLSKKEFIIYAQPNVSQKQIKNFVHQKDTDSSKIIEKLWKKTKGEGVNVAIIDDGFDLHHEDLKEVNLLFSYDADTKNLEATPKTQYDTHGTQVAGIIFAQHNIIGANGVAPQANFIAIRQVTNITSNIILAFTVAKKAKAQIINCSWNSSVLLEPIYDIIKYIAKDTYVVFAAGNKNKILDFLENEAAIPEVITVGSKAQYSNYGKVVDFVVQDKFFTTKVHSQYGNFQGTSATAPFISGLLALNLSLYPNYTQEQILQLLKEQLEN